MLRAYDKATGKEVGAVYIPAPQTDADDLHAERQAVHCRCRQWRGVQRGADRVSLAV